MTAAAERAVRLRAALDSRNADPLKYWHFAVPRLRDAFRLFDGDDPIDELAARACNKGTKTETDAAYVTACLQKRRELDGVPIPQWQGKVEAVCLSLDYNQQVLSVQAAFERVLGSWPHHPRYKGDGILSSIHIQPLGGNADQSQWSVIRFLSQENRRSGVGVRADIALFDEPPSMPILQELRKAGHANRRAIRILGFTPTIRRQWAPLKLDLGDMPRRSLRRIDQERAEVRWSLDEVADWVLSPEAKAKLIRVYKGDPLFGKDGGARLHGDYMSTEGLCPFDVPTLIAMRDAWCSDAEIVSWRIPIEELGGERRARTARTVDVEVWDKPKPGSRYIVTIDASSGVNDGQHDPYEIEITELGTGVLVARCGGYLPGKLVGILAAGLARQYHDAAIDPEVNDRWGVNVVEGVYAARYAKFARERRELSPGEWSHEIGFHNTAQSRPVIIGAVQAWVEAYMAGAAYGCCRSRFVFDTLLDCILDENGKAVAAPGFHDEALIVRGQALRRAVRHLGRAVPELNEPEPSPDDRIIKELDDEALYGGVDDYEPTAGRLLTPKSRPRY